MRAYRWLATALFGLLLLAGCRTEDPLIAEVTTPTGEIVPISRQEFLDYFRFQTSGQNLTQEQIPEAANALFDQLIAGRLGVAEAHAQGVAVDGEELEQAIQQFAGGTTYQELERAVEQRNLGSVETVRRFFLTEDTLTKLFAKTKSTGQTQAHVRMIVFAEGFDNPEATEADLAAADEVNRKAAEQTYQDLQQGADFAKLAAERSADPNSGANGGDIGVVTDSEGLPPEVRVIFQLKDNEISQPTKIQGAWYVFQRLPMTLDDVAKSITESIRGANPNQQLRQERDQWVQDFYDRANEEGRIRVYADPVQVAQENLAQNPPPILAPEVPQQ